MANKFITTSIVKTSANQNEIDAAYGETVTVAAGVIVSTSTPLNGINAARETGVNVFGSVLGLTNGIFSDQFDVNILVGRDGYVYGAESGIVLSGTPRVKNDGTVSGTQFGLKLTGVYTTLVNTGLITAQEQYAVDLQPSGFASLVNYGTIIGGGVFGEFAINAKAGSNEIVNYGRVEGSIQFGDGWDFYDGRAGTVTGSINLGAGDDVAYGGAGGETFACGEGNDQIDGGGGIDFLWFSSTEAKSIAIDLRVTAAQNTGFGRKTIANIESISTGAGNDRIIGTSAANQIMAGEGNNTLDGGLGDDTLYGGSGTDTAVFNGSTAATVDLSLNGIAQKSGYGYDTLYWIDNLIGSSKSDRFKGNDQDNVFDGGLGDDILTGGAGIDSIAFSGKVNAVVDLNKSKQATGYGTDTLISIEGAVGGSGHDRFTGSKFANRLIGNSGNDVLVGNAGNDTLGGGLGNDTLNGGTGIDVADLSGVTQNLNLTVRTGTYKLTIQGTDILTSIEGYIGGSGNDTLKANAYASYLDGGAGNDTVTGGAGNDTLKGGSGNDVISDAKGRNVLSGGVGNDTVTGGVGNDSLSGDEGNDTLSGGDGGDTLNGAEGTDHLTGGAGADIFKPLAKYDYLTGANRDVITDFEVGVDKIDMSIVDPRNESGSFLNLKTGATPAPWDWDLAVGDLFYDPSTGILYGCLHNNGYPQLEIQLSLGLTTLGLNDFIL